MNRVERTSRCSKGSVFARCGCRDEYGTQLGAACPCLGKPGHGSWSFEVRVGPAGGRRQIRRGEHRARQILDHGQVCEYVFADWRGQPVKPSYVSHQFAAKVKTSGLPCASRSSPGALS